MMTPADRRTTVKHRHSAWQQTTKNTHNDDNTKSRKKKKNRKDREQKNGNANDNDSCGNKISNGKNGPTRHHLEQNTT